MFRISFIFCCFLILNACTKNTIDIEKPITLLEQGKLSQESTDAMQKGAFDIFRHTNQLNNDKDNVIISPLSVQFAIGMANNGAKGNTLEQLMSMNGQVGSDLTQLNEQLAYLYNYLIKDRSGLKFNVANGVFYDAGKFTINASYFDALARYYSPEKKSLDFKQVTQSLAVINDWVNDKTNGKIEKVLDDISEDEFMFLINAIYMKADWDLPFPSELTQDQQFVMENGTVQSVPFLSNRLDANYGDNDEVTSVGLPLGKGTLEALFIMPKKIKINEFIENRLDQEFINQQVSNALMSDIILNLPKLKMKQHYDLKKIMQSMGVSAAFTGAADFSGIGGSPGKVYLTRALHDVFFQMDEKGIEGAAVTTVGVGNTSAPPVISFARPFIMVIYDKETKTNLFLGKITNPAASE